MVAAADAMENRRTLWCRAVFELNVPFGKPVELTIRSNSKTGIDIGESSISYWVIGVGSSKS